MNNDEELKCLSDDVTTCIKKLIKDKRDSGSIYDCNRFRALSNCIIDEIGCRTDGLSSLEKEYCNCLQRYCESCYYKEIMKDHRITKERQRICTTLNRRFSYYMVFLYKNK